MGQLSLITKCRAQLKSFLYIIRAIFAAFFFKGSVCPFLEKTA
ncbi:RAxF-45 family protein [Sporolactobacillus shoreicorticis]|uniref:RAxF-45 family protein n=1 Tax=Sporolactobacillus shoreicorticis TaxID=1923877 RepID=A0ABW5S8M1_9BACL